jgi:hypothetical protein
MSAPTTERRTVVIDGRPGYAHRVAHIERRRPPRRSVERYGRNPDRIALWAFLFGLLLVVVAIASAH